MPHLGPSPHSPMGDTSKDREPCCLGTTSRRPKHTTTMGETMAHGISPRKVSAPASYQQMQCHP
jgi:hypothetical protein